MKAKAKPQQPPRQPQQRCAACGRDGELVDDLEDGLLKHYRCCDMPIGMPGVFVADGKSAFFALPPRPMKSEHEVEQKG